MSLCNARAGGRRLPLHTTAARGWLRAARRLAGRCACAPVLIVVPVPGSLLTTMPSQATLPSHVSLPLLTLTVFTLVVTISSETTPGPLDSA